MINKIRSKQREMHNAHDFAAGELYLQHCQQRYDGTDSPNDLLRVFTIKPENIVYGIGKNKGTITLINQKVYTTTLNPESFDKGTRGKIKKFTIDLDSDYMGHFYHIPHGYEDIEDLFGIDLSEHHLKKKSKLEEGWDEEENMAMYNEHGKEILIK